MNTPNEEIQKIIDDEHIVLKIFFYLPNIVGYIRIACLVAAFIYVEKNCLVFIVFYAASHILDQVDGMVARRFNQCNSSLKLRQ